MKNARANEIIESALEFIEHSCNIYNNDDLEQQTKLKHSTIELAAGIELLLKARLCQEHWSLIISNIDKYKEDDWDNGKFVSVGIEQSIERFKQILNMPIYKEAKNAILKLAQLRNKYVHFISRESKEYVTAIQLKAWHYILSLCEEKYIKFSYAQQKKIENIKQKMLQHSEFLDARYEELKEEIEESVYPIITCPFCNKMALRVEDDVKCFICGGEFTTPTDYAEAIALNNHGYNTETAYCRECEEKTCIPVPEELREAAIEFLICRLNIRYEPGMDFEPCYCISCGAIYDQQEIMHCNSCGSAYFSDYDFSLCPECLEYHANKF